MDADTLAGLLVLSAAIISALLAKGHRWLALIGLAAAALMAGVLWAVTGYEEFEGARWQAARLLTALYGGGWSLGVLIGVGIRGAVSRAVATRRG